MKRRPQFSHNGHIWIIEIGKKLLCQICLLNANGLNWANYKHIHKHANWQSPEQWWGWFDNVCAHVNLKLYWAVQLSDLCGNGMEGVNFRPKSNQELHGVGQHVQKLYRTFPAISEPVKKKCLSRVLSVCILIHSDHKICVKPGKSVRLEITVNIFIM